MDQYSSGYLLPDEAAAFKKVPLSCETKPYVPTRCGIPTTFCDLGVRHVLLFINGTSSPVNASTVSELQGTQFGEPKPNSMGDMISAAQPVYQKLDAGTAALPGDVTLYTGEIIRESYTCPSFGMFGFSHADMGSWGPCFGVTFSSLALANSKTPTKPGYCTLGLLSTFNGKYGTTCVDMKNDAAAAAAVALGKTGVGTSAAGIGPVNGVSFYTGFFSHSCPLPFDDCFILTIAYLGA